MFKFTVHLAAYPGIGSSIADLGFSEFLRLPVRSLLSFRYLESHYDCCQFLDGLVGYPPLPGYLLEIDITLLPELGNTLQGTDIIVRCGTYLEYIRIAEYLCKLWRNANLLHPEQAGTVFAGELKQSYSVIMLVRIENRTRLGIEAENLLAGKI